MPETTSVAAVRFLSGQTRGPLSVVPEYISRLHPEYPQKRSDAGEGTDAHHDRSIPEEQRGMSRHGANSHVGIAHRQRDQSPHHHAAHAHAQSDLKEGTAEDVRDDVRDLSPERHTNGDLARAPRDGERRDGINAGQ